MYTTPSMQTLELLAPARDLLTGQTAIDNGADAVYIGAPLFGARAAAGNTLDDIATLCQHAHQYHARVYITVNTMLRDDELPQAADLIHQLYERDVDAILVQDLRLLRQPLPPIALHASTQCDNRTADDVMRLYHCGIRRVVLARELSLQQIADIRRAVPADMELEAFVHGALCVSYSGRCYASEHCFGRSANRGACAQFCRLRFTLADAQGNVIGPEAHYLSLKDMCRLHDLQALAEAGVVSFKIEGRLKDATYVANVTAAYHQALCRLVSQAPHRYRRSSLGHVDHGFTPDVERTFNRGYTDYFLYGKRTADMWSPRTPKAIGQAVATVRRVGKGWIEVNAREGISFSNGDGLCYFLDDGTLQGFRVNNATGYRLIPFRMDDTLRVGTELYRTQDAAFEQSVEKSKSKRALPINIAIAPNDNGYRLTATVEQPAEPTAVSIDYSFTHQQAQRPQTDNMQRQLSKWGNTIYRCKQVNIAPAMADHFLPSSTLSDMRRQLADELDNLLAAQAARYRQESHDCETWKEADAEALAESIRRMPRSYDEAPPTTPLMECRFCLRQALGGCRRHPLTAQAMPPIATRITPGTAPLTLQLPNGRHFGVHFDCQKCQMYITNK